MWIVERDHRVPLVGILSTGGCVTFNVSIVSGRIYPRVLVVDDLLMFLIMNFQQV